MHALIWIQTGALSEHLNEFAARFYPLGNHGQIFLQFIWVIFGFLKGWNMLMTQF